MRIPLSHRLPKTAAVVKKSFTTAIRTRAPRPPPRLASVWKLSLPPRTTLRCSPAQWSTAPKNSPPPVFSTGRLSPSACFRFYYGPCFCYGARFSPSLLWLSSPLRSCGSVGGCATPRVRENASVRCGCYALYPRGYGLRGWLILKLNITASPPCCSPSCCPWLPARQPYFLRSASLAPDAPAPEVAFCRLRGENI